MRSFSLTSFPFGREYNFRLVATAKMRETLRAILKMRRKTFKILTLVFFCLTVIVYGYLKLTHFFEIDSCLDRGGGWDFEKKECDFINGRAQFDTTVVNGKRFAGGYEYETRKPIKPRTFPFDNYTFVTGFPNDSGITSLGLYYGSKEILYETAPDGFYDTVMIANLNNDGIPDFLASYAYEDGASLSGLISNSKINYTKKGLFDEWSGTYCGVGGDTLRYTLPLQIRDINHDGKDDIIANLIRINNEILSISCTDTVFADKIK